MPVMAGMKINTKSDKTRIARGGVMEFLLANHPLDCPICDQGGECDLQDISEDYGYSTGRFKEYKRGVEDKYIGPIVKTTMTRCIHCTRCIRFSEEIAGSFALGTTGRGRSTEISTYVENLTTSELSGNIVDLCPVGALTSKPYAFKARPWELKSVPSVDILDTILPYVQVDSRGVEIMRVLPRINEDVNDEWIGDKSRYALDANKRQRLTVPLIRDKNNDLVDKGWDFALKEIHKIFNSITNPNNDIQAFIGPHADIESIISLKDMLNRLDCENISLGKNSIKVDNTLRSGYLMNSRIRGIEDADLLLLVGINPRYESPVLNARIRKAVNKNNLVVGLIGSPYDLTYDYNHIGSGTRSLIELIQGKHPFCSKIAKAKYPMILVGSSILKQEDGEEIYKSINKLCLEGSFYKKEDKWNGFNILHNDISTIGALEVGIKPYDKKVKNTNNNNKKLYILLGYDDIDNHDIPNDSKVIYIGSHGDKGAERADIVLPGATYFEKNSTYVSTEGRVQVTRPSVLPPYLAREDWEIIRAISEVIGVTLPYDEIYDLRNRIAEHAPHLIRYGTIDYNASSINIINKYANADISLENYVFQDAFDVRIYIN